MKAEESRNDCGATSELQRRHFLGVYVRSAITIALAVAIWSPLAEAASLKAGDILWTESVSGALAFNSSGRVLTRTGPLSADLSLTLVDPEGSSPFLDGFAVDKFGRILGHTRKPPLRIVATDPSSGFAETIATIPDSAIINLVGLTQSIVAMPDGSVVVPVVSASAPNDSVHLVRVYPETGDIDQIAELCEGSGSGPPITLDADGSIVFVCTDASGLVGRVRMESGAVEEISSLLGIPSNGGAVSDGAWVATVVVDPTNGHIVVANPVFGYVFSIDPETGITTTLAEFGFGNISGLALDPLSPGRFIIVMGGSLRSFDPVTGATEQFDTETPSPGVNVVVVQAACNDGFDNDGDGAIDMEDPTCLSPYQDFEARASGSGCGSGFRQASAIFLPLIWVVGRRRMRGRDIPGREVVRSDV